MYNDNVKNIKKKLKKILIRVEKLRKRTNRIMRRTSLKREKSGEGER